MPLPRTARTRRCCLPRPRATFEGFRRGNGKAGTRNYIGILTSVNCSASVARFMAEAVDALGHPGRLSQRRRRRLVRARHRLRHCRLGRGLRGAAAHAVGLRRPPNFAAALVVGLGCEVFQIERLKAKYGLIEGDNFRTMTIQDTGGTKKTIEAGVARIARDAAARQRGARETISGERADAWPCNAAARTAIPASPPIPALGAAVDMLVRHGGTAVLSETPEIYGAEHLLTRRAAQPRGRREARRHHPLVGGLLRARTTARWTTTRRPGNKAGGLTTILEKSLGAAAKGGTTTLTEVYRYAEPVTAKGFVFMDTPGYDPVAATGQVAGGCNVLVLHHGPRLGLSAASPRPPSSSPPITTSIAACSTTWTSTAATSSTACRSRTRARRSSTRSCASPRARRPRASCLGYGDNEFVPWQIGATM